jgi:ADP-heptose:LPS heptosyltransferase
MAPRSNLIILPPDRLDAFTATGVLAELLAFEAARPVHIVTHEDFVPFFADAPASLRFITHRRDNGKMTTMRLLSEAMGHNWHRVISLTATRLPFLLWARHRHHYRFTSGSYALPALFANGKFRPPHIWTPDKLHLALPETLAPDTPLIVLALSEDGRAVWDWRHYAELIWRLSDSVAALQHAHIVVLSHRDCALADSLMEKIPPGQISRFDDLPFAKQAGLMRRARLVIGTDRLAMRMAASLGTALVLRLDRDDTADAGRPYGQYIGRDAAEVARYVGRHLPMLENTDQARAKQKTQAYGSAMNYSSE